MGIWEVYGVARGFEYRVETRSLAFFIVFGSFIGLFREKSSKEERTGGIKARHSV